MMDMFKNWLRKLSSFSLYLLTTEFYHTEQIFILEHIINRIYYIHCRSV